MDTYIQWEKRCKGAEAGRIIKGVLLVLLKDEYFHYLNACSIANIYIYIIKIYTFYT